MATSADRVVTARPCGGLVRPGAGRASSTTMGGPMTDSSCGRCCVQAMAERVVVADGAMGTMLQAQRRDPRRLRRPRGLQRDTEQYPAGHRPVDPRRLPRGRRGLRHHQHVRREPRQPRASTGSPTGSTSCRRRRPASPGRPPTTGRHAGPAALGARLDRPGHQAAHPRPRRVRRAARHLPAQRRGPARAAAPTRSSSRPARTCCRPRRRSSGPGGPSPRPAPACR